MGRPQWPPRWCRRGQQCALQRGRQGTERSEASSRRQEKVTPKAMMQSTQKRKERDGNGLSAEQMTHTAAEGPGQGRLSSRDKHRELSNGALSERKSLI
mmetsp:Transcript_14093/g.40490  ORF Transcript_14093/g.40490 Transcript_14093/m.40490 type:complete len:99 (-) Transcript_14093:45-341(-)